MKNQLAIIFVFGFVSSQFAHGFIYQDLKADAIIIDDQVHDPDDFEPSDVDTTTVLPEGQCVTTSGVYGKCVTKDVCFPYVSYLVGNENKDYTTALQEILGTAEPCPNSDVLICCPNYSYGLPTIKENATITVENSTSSSNASSVHSTGETKESCGSFAYSDSDPTDRVVGGRLAREGEFPWAVALLMNGRQFCGGSLINNNYILTAAHCVQGLRSVSAVSAVLGVNDYARRGGDYQSRTSAQILYHKGFSMQHLQNDVALIRLSSPVTYTKLIQPICLNSGPVPYGKKADLAGWGKTSNNGSPARELRTVNMNVIPRATCQSQYQGTQAPQLTDGMICAGERAAGLKDACNGDSGGPLTYAADGRARQIGVVSWGIGCGEKPGVYTSVARYLDWINKNSQ